MALKNFVSVMLAVVLFASQSLTTSIIPAAYGQPAHTAPGTEGSGNGGTAKIDLDLGSTQATPFTKTHFLTKGPITIDVGGTAKTVGAGTLLTPAEQLATYQVFSTGTQSIQLSKAGTAVGGSMAIGAKFGQYINSLVIPTGVTAVQNAAAASVLHLTGNLTNQGNFYVLSTNPQVGAASIFASNIFNQSGGLLSSSLPAGGLAGYNPAVSSLNLNLSALQNIVNYGTISSSGNLSMSGASIANYGSISAVSQAVLTATSQIQNAVGAQILAQSAILNTASLVNSGLISAANSLTIANLAGNNNALQILNQKGTLTAGQMLSVLSASGIQLGGGVVSSKLVQFTAPDKELFSKVVD